MTFGQFLSLLRARWLLALSVLVATIAVAVALSLLLPKQYTGVSSIVVDIKPDPVSAMTFPTAAVPGFMTTQVDIIESDRVAQRVIRDLRLAESPQIRQQWQEATGGQGTVEQWLVTLLQSKLDVKPSRDSNVINIAYKAPDPRFAAALANAFAQGYLATTLELKVDPARQYTTFFDTRSKDAREALEKAQSKLSAYQRAKGIIASDERLDVENARLNELSSQLVQLQAIASESGSRQVQAQGASGDRMQEVLNNPVIGALKADLARAEGRLQELNARYGENHPQVIEARANIAEQRAKIDAETRKVTGGVGVTNTINRQRESAVRRELADQREKVLKMKAVRDEGMVLQREVENAQRNYDVVFARLTQTSLESQNNQSYANILTTASPPVEPSSPRLFLNTMIGIAVGLLLAIGVALLREFTDRRVRMPEDIHASLGLPVIGFMLKPGAKRRFRGGRIPLMQQRLVGLPAPARGA